MEEKPPCFSVMLIPHLLGKLALIKGFSHTFSNITSDSSRELEGSPLVWHPAIDANFQMLPSVGKFSKEEQLQWERKRLVTSGITSYELHNESGRLIFPAAGSMFQCVDTGSSVANLQPVQLETNCGGARLNCQVCPNLSEMVAFVSNSDVWVGHTESGKINSIFI